MIKKLHEITDIYPGQPIRDRIENIPNGDYLIAQIKDVNKDTGVKIGGLYKTNLKGRSEPRLIKHGDLLFVSRVFRGSQPYSAMVNVSLPNLVAAPMFYILTVNKTLIRAEYLNWFINSEAHGGKFFTKHALGSGTVLNIPKSVLSEMDIIIPPLEKQDQIVKLIQAVKKEKEIMEALIEKRSAFINEVLTKNI